MLNRHAFPFVACCRIAPVCAATVGLLIFLALGSLEASELRFTPVVKAIQSARPSVVNIHGEKNVAATDDRLGRVEGTRRVNGMGTGVVIDERGYIVTNYHVVDGVKKIQVTLADKEVYTATVVSRDPKTDLAVIKIDAPRKLPVMTIGTSSDLMPGESVIAIGNAYGYEHTVTRGIVSALHRTVQVSDAQDYEDLIQTDASINPGNSGGPLLNIDGEMIGINVAVRAGAQGIGFAIPVDQAMAVAADLLSTRRLDKTWHGVVSGKEAAGANSGLVVGSLDASSPASKSGLQPGDVITAVGDRSVSRALDLERALLGRKPGDKITVVAKRAGKTVDAELALAALPDRLKAPEDDPTWSVLGLKLATLSSKDFRRYQTRYRGGLSVTSVRPDSPAAKQGIRSGDILVGMHVWETVSLENVTYILNRPDFADLNPVKFYILRGSETLYGHLSLTMRPKP
ncbi:MAG: trypsin-like peptidase domain-containing protein [Pirellulales bacterium]